MSKAVMANMDRYGHSLYLRNMNISFTPQQQAYINEQLRSGDFKRASEVVRDALRLHRLYRQEVIQELREEIAKGWEGPVSNRKATQIAMDKQHALEHNRWHCS